MAMEEEIPLPLPPQLKSHLEDDCFWILRRNKLLRLPRKPSVEMLLRDYYSHCLATATEETSLTLLAEVLDGVKIYFDFMLADHLLYNQEKAQYKNVMEEVQGVPKNRVSMSSGDCGSTENTSNHCLNSGAENSCATNSDADSKMEVDVDHKPVVPSSAVPMPSSVYGVEHLLRLFVRMPLFLARAQLPTSHVHTLHQYWKELLGYICSRRQELFSEDHYEDVAILLLQPPSTPSLQTASEKPKS